ncbi:hypothetical protein QJQ45_028068 [Haematococcus lacustris]|nr:hypothetical protein QJQ45_028068 [Haematococcus lacustris]
MDTHHACVVRTYAGEDGVDDSGKAHKGVNREADAQPEPSQAQQNMQANGEARWARHHNNTWHVKKCKLHTVVMGLSAAGLEEGAVVASEVVEARLYGQLVLWVEACSKRALLANVLLGLMVRGWFTRVTVLADRREAFEELPAEDAVFPNLGERNLFLQLYRGLPPMARSLGPAQLWRMCWPLTQTSTPASTPYRDMTADGINNAVCGYAKATEYTIPDNLDP